jgi:hypothetical protein
MLTSQLVSFIKAEASDWSRSRILTLCNEIQNIIFTRTIAEFRYFDITTGKDPAFVTIPGTLIYQAINSIIPSITSTTNIFLVEDVYTGNIDDETYKSIDITNTLATVATPASFIFNKDPGVSNVRIECYSGPVQLSSESINLSIPSQWHFPIIYEGVMSIIERIENGKGDRYLNWYNTILPDFYWSMNRNVFNQSQQPYQGGF